MQVSKQVKLNDKYIKEVSTKIYSFRNVDVNTSNEINSSSCSLQLQQIVEELLKLSLNHI